MCEFAYHFKGSSSSMYYRHLLAMSVKYNLNFYGQEIKPRFREGGIVTSCGFSALNPIERETGEKITPFQSRPFDEHIKRTFEEAAKAMSDFSLAAYMVMPNDKLSENAMEFLSQKLKEAIETENYEEAARIRDKINQTK